MKRIITILLGFICTFGGVSCGSGEELARPHAALANSFRAQQDLRAVEELWSSTSVKSRPTLESRIRRALKLHGHDPRAATLQHYLAWILIERGDLAGGERLLATADRAGSGTTGDFSRVLAAAINLRRGNAPKALSALRTLHGSLIVPDHRIICDAFLIEAALATHEVDIAARYMLDLVLSAPPVQQNDVRERITRWIDSASSSELEDAHTSLTRETPAPGANQRDHARGVTLLLNLIRRRLLAAALKEQDAQLARRIMDHYVPEGSGEEIARLAATGSLTPRVAGRSLGLLLELATPTQSQRSAQLALGLSEALGLLSARPGETPVLLKTRSASEGESSIELAFKQLTADGVAVVIAAVSEHAAALAAQLGERTQVPTLLATRPSELKSGRQRTFILGESDQRVTQVLHVWAKQAAPQPQVLVEAGDQRCAPAASAVGGFTFPVGEWKRTKVASVLLFASEDCSNLVLSELGRVQHFPLAVLGLDSAHLLSRTPRSVTFSAGRFPTGLPAAQTTSPERSSWYFALGHDAALFGSWATRDLEAVMTNRPDEVRMLHGKIAGALREASMEGLWTSQQRSFNGELVLERTLGTTAAP